MDFSSANVPISRETWAPRSPPRNPSGGGGAGYSGNGNGADRAAPSGRDERDARDGRDDRDDRAPRGGDRDYRDSREPRGDRDETSFPPPRRPPTAPSRVDPNSVLGVFGLSIRTRERDLEDEFMRHGDVEKVVIVYDQRTDRSRGFGFITMRSVTDATRCIEKLNGLILHGRPIRVDFSATQKPHAPTPGQYMGEKRPTFDDRSDGAPRRYDDRGSRYDDRRGYDRDRHDDRDRYRDRDSRGSRREDDPYGGRSRRDDDRRRSQSPRRRYSGSPERRAPAAPAAESSRY